MQDAKVRVDLFALRDGGTIDGPLLGPLRPLVPTLRRGHPYLVEVVVRTLGLGHPFSQGTADSNEIWVELVARDGDRVLGRSGGLGPDGTVDPYAQFINIYMLDRDGKHIDRRNPQDIFVPLYNKQIPPGRDRRSTSVSTCPGVLPGRSCSRPRLNYRKFDRQYMDHIFGKGQGTGASVVVMASDKVALARRGGPGRDQ